MAVHGYVQANGYALHHHKRPGFLEVIDHVSMAGHNFIYSDLTLNSWGSSSAI